MKKRAGEVAKLTYDTSRQIEPGDVVETETGRRYLVDEARRGRERPDLIGWYRWRLTTIVMAEDDPYPMGAVVHTLIWYPRERRPVLR